jgi:hypothetical protein
MHGGWATGARPLARLREVRKERETEDWGEHNVEGLHG